MIKDKEFGDIPKTDEEIEQAQRDYYKWQARHEWWFALGSSLKQWCKDEDNWRLNRFHRIFYTLKGITCLLLHRHTNFTYKDDPVDVSIFDYHEIGNGGGADVPSWYATFNIFQVGHGYFTGWHYDILFDANA